jgi:hypothetical protein
MKKLLLGAAAAAATLAAASAFAQPTTAPAAAPAPAPQVEMIRAPMKVHTRNEVVQHVRDLFARLDTNRDGYLTRAEADAGHKKMAGDRREKFAKRLADRGPRRIANRGAAFDRLDLNKDGVITRDEFANARPQMNQRRVFVMREGGAAGAPGVRAGRREFRIHRTAGLHGRMFETADANRDARVSLQEATDSALRRFDTADVNRDGQLTPDERRQVRKIRIQRRPA